MLRRWRSLHRPVKTGSASGISRYILGVLTAHNTDTVFFPKLLLHSVVS
jgi:hypothetical protein